jgi:hypothetical protein
MWVSALPQSQSFIAVLPCWISRSGVTLANFLLASEFSVCLLLSTGYLTSLARAEISVDEVKATNVIKQRQAKLRDLGFIVSIKLV